MRKTSPSIDLSTNEALDILKRYTSYASEETEHKQPISTDIFATILEHLPGTVMVIDMHTNLYIYVNTPEIIGFPSQEFIDGGMARVLLAFPAAHGYMLTEQIFAAMFKYFEEYTKKENSKNIKATYQTQLIHKDGSLRWYHHTVSVLSTDNLKRPRMLLKSLVDIQEYKKDTYIDFVISHINTDTNKTEVLYEERYLPEISNTVLSEREAQVLSLISVGMTSAQIAEKLFISQHTVNTHRKNILRKTFCKGTADLAIFALTAKEETLAAIK
ncbi:helix-turn-helix domain-containing protein [Cytophaga aurantiaca]|uniref:helix-turn-helix domain-containing protein n=1 Tax=Cytophaga aurantiaca TaxID=29530 RepID=UPI00036FCB72|nr:helix-turn-helix transcriptional regulator [Cytophaga aurantiaca]